VTLANNLASLGWGIARNVDDSTGTIRVSIYSQDVPLTVGPAGLLNLNFSVPSNAPAGVAPINIVNPNQGGVNGSRLNENSLVLSPDNGSVTVSGGV
jgi:hypothetical protein